MRRVAQFWYRNEDDITPSALTWEDFTSGSLLSTYGTVTQLGIQGPTGMQWYLNNGSSPLTMGATGIYELDMENVGRITSIRLLDSSKSLIEGNSFGLVIDIAYEGGTAV